MFTLLIIKAQTNREMKEKIKDHLMMVDKYASTLDSDIECHADEIMELINQEVEKRISERMSDKEIRIIALNYAPPLMYSMGDKDEDVNYSIRNDVIEILTKLRSRLACSEKPNKSQKTEGGEG